MQRALLAAVAAAVLVPSAAAADKRGFAFGRQGGSIRPYSVSIANDGTVKAYGAVDVGRARLTRLELAELNRIATAARFTALPDSTRCEGVLPDVATTFVRVGARTVRVHGDCLAGYRRLLKALGKAVDASG